MTTDATSLLNARTAALDNEEARIAAARAEVARLTAELEAAQQELRNAEGYRGHSRRMGQRTGLNSVRKALDSGSKGIVVTCGRGADSTLIPGAIIKVTAARATVLTERGEMVFDLKGSTWKRPGEGMGDNSSYSIDPTAL